ncbi:hypothetical protein D5E85_14115 [Vibrio parahaemolyticus]|nr:hypothetical protein D5E85_14115 [Vibrio parahaemolyticus]
MKGIIWKATYVLTCQKIYTVFKKNVTKRHFCIAKIHACLEGKVKKLGQKKYLGDHRGIV